MLNPRTEAHYRTLAMWLAELARRAPCPVVGLQGAQGSGKTTVARFLQRQLADQHGLTAAVLSLDDCYLPREARQGLAVDVHPLLATRGVPGTHDVALGRAVLDRLRQLKPDESMRLPRFSKADDDRASVDAGASVTGPIDLILFEGWCVGVPAQPAAEIAVPVNALEADDDRDGRWRTWVNERLATDYTRWFAAIDAIIVLQAPSFDVIHRWRWQQEQETARTARRSGAGLMTEDALRRFIQHYQRLTEHAMRVLPARADVVVELRDDRDLAAIRYRDQRAVVAHESRR